jgi:nucleotide-binding universal stress UspA family protein
MFECILVCYDGTARCRSALERAAELATLSGASVHLLGLTPPSYSNAALLATALGTVWLAESPYDERALISEPLQWLRAREVVATGKLAPSSDWEYVLAHARTIAADLIVLARYPQGLGSFWWPTGRRPGDRTHCCILEVASQD